MDSVNPLFMNMILDYAVLFFPPDSTKSSHFANFVFYNHLCASLVGPKGVNQARSVVKCKPGKRAGDQCPNVNREMGRAISVRM